MKKVLIILVLVAVAGAAYWYGSRSDWFTQSGPNNLPTAEERERMAEVERRSATVAPDAIPGIRVREPGSTPPPAPIVEEVSSTTEATTSPSE